MIDRNHIVYDKKENYKYRYIIEDNHYSVCLIYFSIYIHIYHF